MSIVTHTITTGITSLILIQRELILYINNVVVVVIGINIILYIAASTWVFTKYRIVVKELSLTG
ncbi:MAG: hypothetical protein ACI9LY_002708 [Arenicella sp.]|jgi:hypothetical protein